MPRVVRTKSGARQRARSSRGALEKLDPLGLWLLVGEFEPEVNTWLD
jgi:hypothetical protein